MTSAQRDAQLRKDTLDFFANPPWLWPVVGSMLFFSISVAVGEQTLKAFGVPTFTQLRDRP